MVLHDAAALAGLVIFAAGMVAAGLVDLTTMKIRNGLVLLLAAAYVVLAPLAGFGWAAIGWSFAATAVALVCAVVLFALRWIGGGDAKLATVTILWLGPEHALAYVALTALFGALLAASILVFRAFRLPGRMKSAGWVARLHSPRTGMPYGIPMAAAALVVLPQTLWAAPL